MTPMVDATQLEDAASVVYSVMAPTPQNNWPLLSERAGCALWVKHENQTPAGAFKLRGGLVYMANLVRERPEVTGVIAATRGNHGQSVALAATRHGLSSTVVVPHGNSLEKNASMRCWGGELIVHGADFQESLEHARLLAAECDLHMVQSFEPTLVAGVATYGLELFEALPDLDAVYVPIGLGSGICGMMAARDVAGSYAEIWGVVAENASAYALSFEAGRAVSTNSADTLADGMACRVPVDAAVAAINAGAAGITRVSEEEIKAAMRAYFTDTHNVAEGAGAAPLAALLKDRERWRGRNVGVVLSGGNVDMDLYRSILMEGDPSDEARS